MGGRVAGRGANRENYCLGQLTPELTAKERIDHKSRFFALFRVVLLVSFVVFAFTDY